MTVDVRYHTTKKWEGGKIELKIATGAVSAIQKATEHLAKRIRSKLLATRGSVPTDRVGWVKSVRSSQPGEVPFWQTGNLANSVKPAVTILKTKVKGQVSTRVKYARTLENGGFTEWSGQQHLRFTDLKLVNPIRKSGQPIAPRPVWRPTFEEENNKMLEIVKSEMKKVF